MAHGGMIDPATIAEASMTDVVLAMPSVATQTSFRYVRSVFGWASHQVKAKVLAKGRKLCLANPPTTPTNGSNHHRLVNIDHAKSNSIHPSDESTSPESQRFGTTKFRRYKVHPSNATGRSCSTW